MDVRALLDRLDGLEQMMAEDEPIVPTEHAAHFNAGVASGLRRAQDEIRRAVNGGDAG